MAAKRRSPQAKPRKGPGARGRSTGKSSEKKLLEKARQLSKRFHGTGGEVVELSPSERKPLPRYVVLAGDLEEFTYAPDRSSKRGAFKWRHESGDRGSGKPRSKNRPMVVVDPRTGRPAIVQNKSPMRFSPRGFVG